jgi:hypothetical protein
MKYFIISQPKAGTYLAANLLENMKISPSKLHFDPGLVRRFKTLKEFEEYNISFNKALKNKLKDGEFAVGHMHYVNGNIAALKGIKKILLIRDKKEIKESAKRYLEETGISVWSIINDRSLELIERWSEHKGIFVLEFKDIINKNTKKIDEMQQYIFGEIKFNSLEIINKSLEQDSLTKSSIRK